MANLVMSHEERDDRTTGDIFHHAGNWLFAVLMIFLGLSGPSLGYIKAVEPPTGAG